MTGPGFRVLYDERMIQGRLNALADDIARAMAPDLIAIAILKGSFIFAADLIRAGQLLKMELLDHVIVGNGNFSSLRTLGYFYS